MTDRRQLKALLLFAAMAAISGCEDRYGITTIISSDGSCERIITVRKSSRELSKRALPLPIDSTWKPVWTEPKKEGDEYVLTASKRFETLDSLRSAYARVADPGQVKVHITLEKHFRWFYTYYRYDEVYEVFNPISALPVSMFMTQDELCRYIAGEKCDSLRRKHEEWEERNSFEYVYQRIRKAAADMRDPRLPDSLFRIRKEELFQAIVRGTSRIDASPGAINSAMADYILRACTTVLRRQAVWRLRYRVLAIVTEFNDRRAIGQTVAGNYTNTVVMPGTILETNAGAVKGNSAVWEFTGDQLSTADYAMRVESRSANFWTLLGTGGVVVALAFGPVVARARRTTQRMRMPEL